MLVNVKHKLGGIIMSNENEKKECQKEKTVVDVLEAKVGIKVIDDEGYDIEQFLCRCSNKTGVASGM